MVTVRISAANLPGVQDTATRTVLNGDNSVTWNKGDEVFVVTSDIKDGIKMTNIEEDGPTAVFEAQIPMDGFKNSYREAVIYPFRVKEWSGNSLKEWFVGAGFDSAVLPGKQQMEAGTFARDYNLSAAIFELNNDEPLYFHNLCGLLRVNVKGNTTVKSIKITAPAKINGKFRVEGLDKKVGKSAEFRLEMTRENDGSDTVELVSEEGFSLTESLQSFYASVLPKALQIGSTSDAGPGAGDYVVTITTVEGKVVTETVTLDKDIKASKITDLGNFEVSSTFADADGNVYEMKPTGGSFELNYIESAGEPVVAGAPEWVSYTAEGGKITFSTGAYCSTLSRSCQVSITQGETAAELTINQDGFYKSLAGINIKMDPTGASSYGLPYSPSLGELVITAPGWLTYTIDEAEGKIIFTVEAYVSGAPRTGEIVITNGSDSATFAVSQRAVPLVSVSSVYSDTDAHEGYVIEKSSFFTEEFTLVEELDWMTAVKNEAGNIVISVDANGTGAIRTGAVLMKVGENVVQTINVTQTTFNYSSFLGNYKMDCKLMDNSVGTSDWPKVQQNTSDVDYILYFEPESWQRYYIVAEYVPIGPGCITLVCPKQSLQNDRTYPNYGAWVPFLHAARKHSDPNFLLTTNNYEEIDAAEGCGFDLVPVVEGGILKGFDFVPNAKARELYPEGLDAIWLPEYKTTKKDSDDNVLEFDTDISNGRIMGYYRALEGQEYLRITKK